MKRTESSSSGNDEDQEHLEQQTSSSVKRNEDEEQRRVRVLGEDEGQIPNSFFPPSLSIFYKEIEKKSELLGFETWDAVGSGKKGDIARQQYFIEFANGRLLLPFAGAWLEAVVRISFIKNQLKLLLY
ncbi:hypothetical protein Ancab_005186 [Ancistrocladus abbreviatus]